MLSKLMTHDKEVSKFRVINRYLQKQSAAFS